MNPAAIEAMSRALAEVGNASSLHTNGRAVRKSVDDARDVIAKAIGCQASEIIFTGSGTEANNTAIKGIYWYRNSNEKRPIVITSAIEHQAVLEPAQWLVDHEGAEHIQIPVSQSGIIDLHVLRSIVALHGDSIALISIMHSNNETGVLQPVSEVVSIAGDIPVHTDAVQSFIKVPLSFSELGVMALSISGHKIGGPLGIGALILRRGIDIPALLHGGGQEREIRSGTINAPSIVGMAAAISANNYDAREVENLRKEFEERVLQEVNGATLNGASAERLPGIVNVTFPGTANDILLLLFDSENISCSTGAACSAGVHRPSHVLLAMGHDEKSAMSSLRFSIGAATSREEVEEALSVLPAVISRGVAVNCGGR
jgi:cysteine desulfurase